MVEDKILHFRKAVEVFTKQIENLSEHENVGMSLFILMSCLVDTLASYRFEQSRQNERYIEYIKRYLGRINPRYLENAQIIYASMRCSLVHNFTINNGILLGENIPHLHLSRDNQSLNQYSSYLHIDLHSLFRDIKDSMILLFNDIGTNNEVQEIFNRKYEIHPPFVGYKRTVNLFDENVTVSGSPLAAPEINYEQILWYRYDESSWQYSDDGNDRIV